MDLEQKAIQRIKTASEMSLHHYGKPLICTYSGGKDSDVMLELFKRSGVPFEVLNNHTTADAPQTVWHIRKVFKKCEDDGIECKIEYPYVNGEFMSMWKLIPCKLMPPTRKVRYCCEILKERGGGNRFVATGVRWDESTARNSRGEYERIGHTKNEAVNFSTIMLMNDNDAKRRMNEFCMKNHKMVVNPIIDWKHSDIWEFINSEKIETCKLYQCGYDRVGCIGCPMAGKRRYKEFADFPKYRELYIRTFDRMIEERKRRKLSCQWECGEEVFFWWMEDQNVKGQMELSEFIQY